MHDLQHEPSASPAPIYRHRDGIYAVELFIAALVEFDLFSEVGDGTPTLGELCESLGVRERPADVLVTLLVAQGYLEREGDRVRLTAIAREHLDRRSPWFLGPYYASLRGRPLVRDLARTLREDRAAHWAGQEDEWAKKMEDPDFADRFTAEMDCRGVVLGPAVARVHDWSAHSRVLDVGGGSGIYACAIAARHDGVRATVLEKPPVDAIAARAIARRDLSSRVQVHAGDMFADDWPSGHDAHLLSNVLHDWGVERVRELLARSHAALPSGGTLVVHDAHLDEHKTGPLAVAEYSVLLMHFTEGRCYGVGELGEWLREAGFVGVRHVPSAAERSLVIATKP